MICLFLQRQNYLLSRPFTLTASTHSFLSYASLYFRFSLFCSFPRSRYSSLTNMFRLHAAENQWLHLKLITDLKKSCREVFPVVEYAYTTIPTYPSGQIGFMVCCKDATRDVKKPIRTMSDEEEEKLFRYYNKRIHEASFVLPTFAAVALK